MHDSKKMRLPFQALTEEITSFTFFSRNLQSILLRNLFILFALYRLLRFFSLRARLIYLFFFFFELRARAAKEGERIG